jgi:hypothetical protein
MEKLTQEQKLNLSGGIAIGVLWVAVCGITMLASTIGNLVNQGIQNSQNNRMQNLQMELLSRTNSPEEALKILNNSYYSRMNQMNYNTPMLRVSPIATRSSMAFGL